MVSYELSMTQEANDLRKAAVKTDYIPGGQNAPDRAPTLLSDDVGKAEAVGHQENADDGHGHRKLVTDHLCGAAQSAEQRVLAGRSPPVERDAIDAQVQHLRLIQNRGADPRPARVVGV